MPPSFRRPLPIDGRSQVDPTGPAPGRRVGPLGKDSGESFLQQLGGDLLIPAAAPIRLSSIQLSGAIVRVAGAEWERWNRPHKIKETQEPARRILQTYWKVGVGWKVTDQQLKNKAWQNTHPWSAAFISYVMRMAGSDDRFLYAAAHATYIRWAIANRLGNRDNPFKGYRVNEVVPKPGDLVGKSRSHSGATYDSIQHQDFKTHCDIVTEVNGNQLVTIGGNVSDSVSKTLVTLDGNGHVNQAHYFVVIQVEGIVPFFIKQDPSSELA